MQATPQLVWQLSPIPAGTSSPHPAPTGCTRPAAGVAMPAMNNLVARNIDPAHKATALGGCYTGFHTGEPLNSILTRF